MSQFSIRARLVFLAVLLLAILTIATVYLTRGLSNDAAALGEEAKLIAVLKAANKASKDFGDLKYWLTDLAVSLLVRSQQNAEDAKAQLADDLKALSPYEPDGVTRVEGAVAGLMEQALKAVDAYTNDQRVVGNALMAQTRANIQTIDGELAKIVDRLERDASAKRDAAVRDAEGAVDFSGGIGILAFTLAAGLTTIIVRSITRPLGRLERAMQAITGGNFDVEIPPAGHDEIGAMTRTLGMLRDSLIERKRLEEQRRQAEAEVKRAQARLSEAIETISEGFVLYDADDRLVICNSRYREMYAGVDIDIKPGVAYEAVLRAAAAAGVIPDAANRIEEWLVGRLQRHRHPERAYEQQRGGGRWLKISERATADRGVVGVYTDITELKARETQLGELVDRLADARDQATQATLAKSRFLANMSHELRTPLNAVIGITEMLIEDAQDEGQTGMLEPLQRITRAGKHLLHLINEVLDLSKIEAGKLDLHYEDIDVPTLVGDVVGAAQPLAAKGGNKLVVECREDVGAMHADMTRVRQIVLNLLSNACKFTEKGTVTLTAGRDRADGEEWVRFRVSDTGIGMTEEQLGRLFQEFMQADSSTTRKYGGTGLGLAISQRLAALMGGAITVESKPNVGTSFTVRLPAGRSSSAAESAVSAPDSGEGPTAAASGRRTNCVLVVDDDATVRNLMRRFLSREGFDVVTAESGPEAIAIARELHPSIITLDVIMPEMDGWSVLQAFKADPDLASIPIVMVTIVDEKQKGFTLGASGFLNKPIDRGQLAAILARFKTATATPRALVVEDDVSTREMMRRLLVGEGWEVALAGNGREALDEIARAQPNLILLDLLMPEMDGFDFLAAYRKMPGYGGIPVIIVTAADLTEGDRRRLNGGVEHILQKAALSEDELLQQIRQLVGRYATAA
jgi:signal transduction histidine kinase/CheY-like chemotaxis protein